MPPIGPSPAISISGSLRWWTRPSIPSTTANAVPRSSSSRPRAMSRPVMDSPWDSPSSAQEDGACGAILGQGLVQALDDIAPLAQVTQALLRVSCEDPARRPRRLGETQPLEFANSPDPDLPQRISRGSPVRPKINDPIRRPRFPGQHPIETCPAFGRHCPFEALAHLEL